MSNALAPVKRGGQLAGRTPRGLEDIGAEDLIIPKVLLLQFNSKLVKEQGKTAGTYLNGGTMEDLGKSFEFIPIKATKYVDALKPEGKRMVFEFRTYKLEDPRLAGRRYFPKDGVKANATTVMSFLVLINGLPAVIAFKSTGYNTGKRLASQSKLLGEDLFNSKYKLTIKNETKEGETYFVMDFERIGPSTDAEFKTAEDTYNARSGRMHEVDAPEGAKAADEPGETSAQAASDKPGATDTFEESKTDALPAFTKVRVLKTVRDDADKTCPTCSEVRAVKDGNVKTNDPETNLPWGKVKALVCKKCNKVDVIEKLAD